MREIKNIFSSAKIVGADVSSEEYRRFNFGPRGTIEFVMSRGELSEFIVCPSKWKAGAPDIDSSSTRYGTLIDTLLLSPEKFESLYAVYPSTYPCEPTSKDSRTEKPWNNNATFCKDWKRERDGKSFIHREKMTDAGEPDEETNSITLGNAERAIEKLVADRDIAQLVAESKKQMMIVGEYHDAATGLAIKIKTLLDIVPPASNSIFGKSLLDFKTARNASEKAFKDAINDNFNDWQAALYFDAYSAATNEDRADFKFLVQENIPPYQVALWTLGTEWLNEARAEIRQALEFYCSCLASGKWPGYPASMALNKGGCLSREAWMMRTVQRPLELPPEKQPEQANEVEEIVP